MAKFDVKIEIDSTCGRDGPSGKKTFTNNDVITGKIHFRTLKDVAIKSINIDLNGKLKTVFHRVNERSGGFGPAGRRSPRTYTEKHTFMKSTPCNLFPTNNLSSENEGYTFTENSEHVYAFELVVPQNANCTSCKGDSFEHPLPPTFPKIHTRGGTMSATINYNISVNIRYVGFLSLNQTKHITKPFIFHPTKLPTYSEVRRSEDIFYKPEKINIQSTYTFPKKVKKFIDTEDPEKPEAIQCPINNDRRFTRMFYQMFNDHYKSDNYSKYVCDVPLNVTLTAEKQEFVPPGGKIDDLNFILTCPVESLYNDFILKCNESSKLGEFVITGVKIILKTHTFIQCQGRKHTQNRKLTVFEYTPNEKFDVAYFIPGSVAGPDFAGYTNGVVEIGASNTVYHKEMSLIDILVGEGNQEKNFAVKNIKIPDDSIASFRQCNLCSRWYDLSIQVSISKDIHSSPHTYKFSYPFTIAHLV